jgi:hypothetical protein
VKLSRNKHTRWVCRLSARAAALTAGGGGRLSSGCACWLTEPPWPCAGVWGVCVCFLLQAAPLNTASGERNQVCSALLHTCWPAQLLVSPELQIRYGKLLYLLLLQAAAGLVQRVRTIVVTSCGV